MPFSIDQVVPWGRSFQEYQRMFALCEEDFQKPILGCGDGPAAFNKEAGQRGYQVLSCDPIYQFSAPEITRRIEETAIKVLDGVRNNQDDFVWDAERSLVASPEELYELRMSAMRQFLNDYSSSHNLRYIAAAVPHLPFRDRQFGLVLSSHFLFLYSQHLGFEFHRRALRELLRVADEVRIFPLLQIGGAPSPWVEPLCAELRAEGFVTQRVKVLYEFQKGGDKMLVLRHSIER
jgi:hypothetical protein